MSLYALEYNLSKASIWYVFPSFFFQQILYEHFSTRQYDDKINIPR